MPEPEKVGRVEDSSLIWVDNAKEDESLHFVRVCAWCHDKISIPWVSDYAKLMKGPFKCIPCRKKTK